MTKYEEERTNLQSVWFDDAAAFTQSLFPP